MLSPVLRCLTRQWVRRYQPRRPPTRKVAIVVPLSHRTELQPTEQISLRHLVHYLGRYDKYLIAPQGLPVRMEGFNVRYFSGKFFGSVAAHNQLLLSPLFYQAFADYKFVFFYHLDSLAFSDQLEQWCETHLDYIGPPWIPCSDTPWVTKARVGNGGFTLLRVESALKVLYNRYRLEPSTYWTDLFTRNGSRLGPLIRFLESLRQRFPRWRTISRLLREWQKVQAPALHSRNNDMFWSDQAARYLPEFKVASVEEGLRFAFEGAPRMCFELNRNQLPFGCHAWAKFDRAFWEPHLLAAEPKETAPANRVAFA